MKVTIDIPDTLRPSLEKQFGQNLTQAAKEAMAIAWYQAEKLSIGRLLNYWGYRSMRPRG